MQSTQLIWHCAQQHKSLQYIIALCIFVATLQFCWITEYTHLFEKIEKTVDARMFLILVAALFIFTSPSWTTISEKAPSESGHFNPETSLLPREQTEEWKGWMQVVILLYHYFGLSGNLPVYQVIRVLVAMYMFLTGYSHTTYFLKTKKFAFERTARMLIRLNLLSCLLAYALNKNCDFYYFPGLTTFWHLVILVTLRSARTPSASLDVSRVSVNLALSCIIVQTSLYTHAGNSVWETGLAVVGAIGGPNIDAREFIFRLKLDSITPFWGACLAVLAVKTGNRDGHCCQGSLDHVAIFRRFLAANSLWCGLGVIVPYFLLIQQFHDKVTSNKWHPVLSIIPIATMLLVRNATTSRRQKFNDVFRWLGTISLDTYVLQSHIWLTKSNKALLHIALFDHHILTRNSFVASSARCLDKLIITATFLAVSHATAHATRPSIDWIIGSSYKRAIILLTVCWMLNLHWHCFIH